MMNKRKLFLLKSILLLVILLLLQSINQPINQSTTFAQSAGPGYPSLGPGYPGYPSLGPSYPGYPSLGPGYPGYPGYPSLGPGYPGYPAPAPAPATCSTSCSACPTTTTCGQTTYDTCTPACSGSTAIYNCQASGNANCTGTITCSSETRCVPPPTCSTSCSACPTTTTCGQTTYDTCTPACSGSTAIYNCYASANPGCAGTISCSSETRCACITSIPAPTGLNPNGTTFASTTTTVNLSWNAVSEANRYAVRLRDDTVNPSGTCGSSGVTCVDNVTGTSYTFNNLIAGHSYTWWVHAIKNASGSCLEVWSPQATANFSVSAQTYTIGGRVINSVTGLGISGVTINQGVTIPPGCNIGTAITNSNGDYLFSNVAQNLSFCLRPPPVSGYTETSPLSYENQTATANKTDYNFNYTLSCVTSMPAPTGLNPNGTTFSSTTTTVNLSWSLVSGANRYAVRLRDNNINPTGTCGSVGVTCWDNITTTSFSVSVVASHSYTWWVHAIKNASGSCLEVWSPQATANFSVSLPLSVTCSVSPAITTVGQPVIWTAEAQGGSSSYTYSWSGDSPLAGRTGNPVTETYSTTGTKSGAVTVTDSSSPVQSATSTNTCSVTITAPDLIVDSLSPVSATSGSSPTFSGIVRNQGNGSAGASSTRLRIDTNNDGTYDTTIPNQATSSLAAGGSETESWPSVWTAPACTLTTPCPHRFEICADIILAVSESNEANNCSTQTLTVSPAGPQGTGSCGTGVARATDLVSTFKLTGTFSTSSSACVIDSRAAFYLFKIPTFLDLKSLYFDQKK